MDIEEKMARAMCRASGQDPDHNYDPKGIYRTDDIRWRFYIPHVRAIMAELPGNPIYQTFCTEDDPIRQDFWMDVSQEAYEHLKGQDGVRCRVVYPSPAPQTATFMDLCQVLDDIYTQIGCDHDNEAALVAIDKLQVAHSTMARCLSDAIEFMRAHPHQLVEAQPLHNRRAEIVAAG